MYDDIKKNALEEFSLAECLVRFKTLQYILGPICEGFRLAGLFLALHISPPSFRLREAQETFSSKYCNALL